MGLSGILTAVLPHIHELYTLLSILFINGCFWGACDAAGCIMMLHIWGKGEC